MRTLRRSSQRHTSRAVPAWQRDIRLLAISRGVTMAGAEAGYIAVLALAWQLTGSASQASLVLLASVVAQTAGAPLAGWIGDRYERRRVIITAELVVASALLGMAVAQTLWQLMLAMAVSSFAGLTCGSALDAAIPNLVPRRELARANATLGMARTVGHMAGPVLGGIAVAALGARAAFVFDAATSVAAALLVLCIRAAMTDRERASSSSSSTDGIAGRGRHGMLEGLRLLASDPVLRLLMVGWAGMTVCFAFVTAAELPLAVEYGVDEAGLGAIISSWCAGSLVGAWWSRRIHVERFGARVLVLNAIACAVVFGAVSIVPAFWCVLALMAIGGASMALAGVVQTTLVQQHVEDEVRARVLAANQGVNSAIWGANLALGGLLVETWSPGTAYLLGGAWCLVGALGFVALARSMQRQLLAHTLRVLRPRHALEAELAEGA